MLNIRVDFSVPTNFANSEIIVLRGLNSGETLAELFLQDPGFRSEFNDEAIIPLVLFLHQLRHLSSEFGLLILIDDSAKSYVSIAIHFERDSGVVLDVSNPVSLFTIL